MSEPRQEGGLRGPLSWTERKWLEEREQAPKIDAPYTPATDRLKKSLTSDDIDTRNHELDRMKQARARQRRALEEKHQREDGENLRRGMALLNRASDDESITE
jgi:hypothetical protein